MIKTLKTSCSEMLPVEKNAQVSFFPVNLNKIASVSKGFLEDEAADSSFKKLSLGLNELFRLLKISLVKWT